MHHGHVAKDFLQGGCVVTVCTKLLLY